MIRILLILVVCTVLFLLVRVALNYFNVDRPAKKENKRAIEENRVLRRVLSEVDADARADYTLTQRPIGAVISDKITEARKSLD